MAMIDAEPPVAFLLAELADPVLRGQHPVVLARRESILDPRNALMSLRGFPFPEFGIREPLQPSPGVDLLAVLPAPGAVLRQHAVARLLILRVSLLRSFANVRHRSVPLKLSASGSFGTQQARDGSPAG